MNSDLWYQCQALRRDGSRCKCKATHFHAGKNLCTAHHTLSLNRWKERSRTYQGIANAMAEQWGTI